jgi:hypothetical protein
MLNQGAHLVAVKGDPLFAYPYGLFRLDMNKRLAIERTDEVAA